MTTFKKKHKKRNKLITKYQQNVALRQRKWWSTDMAITTAIKTKMKKKSFPKNKTKEKQQTNKQQQQN